MDREDRWDQYIRDHYSRENEKFENISPFVEEFLSTIRKEKVSRVLDLGCGLGRHAQKLVRMGFKTVGFDISGETLELAEKSARAENLNIQFVQGDYVDLPFDNGVFGAVLAIDTIHHDFFENITRGLKEVHRVLASDGLLCANFLSTGDEIFGKGRRLGDKLFVIHRIPHCFFDLDELMNLMERLYFKVETIKLEKYDSLWDGEKIGREKFKLIARRQSRRKAHFTPIQQPVYW